MGRHNAGTSFGLTTEVWVVALWAVVVLATTTHWQGALGAGRYHSYVGAAKDAVSVNDTGTGRNASLEYYVQVVVGTPYTGEVVPALDTNTTYSFGSIEVFDFNITAGTSNVSESLGHVRGYTVQVSYTSTSHEVEVEVVSYDDGAGTNGTLSLQGLVNVSTNEIAIAGGSGSFRGARGYVIITMINPNVYHHAVYFL